MIFLRKTRKKVVGKKWKSKLFDNQISKMVLIKWFTLVVQDLGIKPLKRRENPFRSHRYLALLPLVLLVILCIGSCQPQLDRVAQSTRNSYQFQLKQATHQPAQKVGTDQILLHLQIASTEPNQDLVFNQLSGGREPYANWLNKLLFGLDKHIELNSGKVKEVPLSQYMMERNFGMTPGRTFLLAFPRYWEGEDLLDKDHDFLEVSIEEFGLHTGTVRLQLSLPLETPQSADLKSQTDYQHL